MNNKEECDDDNRVQHAGVSIDINTDKWYAKSLNVFLRKQLQYNK